MKIISPWRSFYKLRHVLTTASILFIFCACSAGAKPPENRFFTPGKAVPVVSCSVGGGAVCLIENTKTPLDGIEIYGGKKEVLIDVLINTGTLQLPEPYKFHGAVTEIRFNKELEEPLKIIVPGKSGVVALHCFLIKTDGSLAPVFFMPAVKGSGSQSVTGFYTFVPGLFVCVY